MKALIIAAGRGIRLEHNFSPKPLTPIFGLTLIERILLTSKLAGIDEFVVVIGYKSHKIIKKLGDGEKYGVEIKYVTNPEWEKGNGISVLKAREYLKNENFILLMSDHLFNESILKKLKEIELKDNNCVLCIDRNLSCKNFDISDATKAWVENGCIKKIGKDIDNYNVIDTGIFLCSPEIFDALEESVSRREYSLSAGNQILSDNGNLKILDITGNFWVDVDDDVSLKSAKKNLIKGLTKLTDGPISKFLNRFFSTRISSKLANYNISPNELTIFSFVMALLTALFFYFGNSYTEIVIGGILAQFSSIVDGCDGEIARLKFKFSEFGTWLDRILDRYADGLIIVGITNYCLRTSSNELVWLVGFLALIGTFMNSYSAIPYDEILKNSIISHRNSFRLGRDIRLFVVFVGAIFNQLFLTLIFFAIITNIETVRRLFVIKYEYRFNERN